MVLYDILMVVGLYNAYILNSSVQTDRNNMTMLSTYLTLSDISKVAWGTKVW